ncbi:hypothetical protein VHUM_01589 [Vanrija humicola]|uniref:Peptide hydrolase n=1 Tax=Vanrija humicola TaxID=5417 RepID=A0A7D8Z1K2_VANHU|nr:hypothetical protein VHUM_01589 [Vanrija humicola]
MAPLAPLLSLLLALGASAAPSLLITPSAPARGLAPCLSGAYHGQYGGQHVFLPSDDCIGASAGLLSAGSIVPTVADEVVVWVGRAGVQGAEKLTPDALFAHIDAGARRFLPSLLDDGAQKVFAAPAGAALSLLHASEDALFISVPRAALPVLDTLLPPTYVPVGVAPSPVPLWDVPEHYAKHLANVTHHLRFRPEIAAVVNTIDADDIRRDVRWLTGEAPSGIVSRHSFTEGARVAAKWIKEKVEATGADCEYFPYLEGFSPDVLCTYPSDSTERVILSGHYDSRGSFGSTRAPGADDDGSGTSHVLAVAAGIAAHNITFDKRVTLAFFSGEEQGLWGSHYWAKHLAAENATVVLQIQADMLAYRVPGEPLQLGLPATIELPEAGWLVANVSALYAPELVVGRTEACCSDHQSFISYGFPATQVFERNGWIADPMYHNSGDLADREGYDFDQIASIAKVTFATVLEVAGFKTK